MNTYKHKKYFKIFLIGYLLIWISGKLTTCIMSVESDWGPEVSARLNSGDVIVFRSRSVGKETDDQLVWIKSSGESIYYWVDQIHAGFYFVSIKTSNAQDRIWIESDGMVKSALDLSTGEFWDESKIKPSWAAYGTGLLVGSGYTKKFSFFEFIVPW